MAVSTSSASNHGWRRELQYVLDDRLDVSVSFNTAKASILPQIRKRVFRAAGCIGV